MFWTGAQDGSIVNLARCNFVRVRSNDSRTGKHEVVAWGDVGEAIILFSSPRREECVSYLDNLFSKLVRHQVLDRAPQPTETADAANRPRS